MTHTRARNNNLQHTFTESAKRSSCSLAEHLLDAARAHFSRKNWDDGLDALRKALEKRNTDKKPRIIIKQSITLLRTYQYTEVASKLEIEALRLYPDDLIFNMMRINTLCSERAYTKALDLIEVAREKFPKDERLAHRHGTTLHSLGRESEALEVMTRASRDFPSDDVIADTLNEMLSIKFDKPQHFRF